MHAISTEASAKADVIQDCHSAEIPANHILAEHSLTLEQFQIAIAAAYRQFNMIRKTYVELKAYLVVGLKGEQTKLDGTLIEMLKEFHGIMYDDAVKPEMIKFLKVPFKNGATKGALKSWQERFSVLAEEVKYNGLCRVEIRFLQLNYALIWKLQVDERVDRAMTPQTKASIRIVLGTISEFAKCTNFDGA